MSKTAHDQYIDADEEEETCPLCIEDFDLTDKGFRPCPCGYQICQFCYNSIKNNMNGLCPACRRVYDDKQIEYKVITPEETAAYKARQAQKQKKTQAALQKERQKAEADSLSRKHLAGLRVVQKNLVYVTGIAPKMQEDELLQTLRGDKYFGQYGKIIKIVVSKARDKHDSVGVYVTYERKEDAASCIAAVDGTTNGDRTLRAQFGTTKYCSAYLRGDTCMNRNCMFLHEPGEAKDSYSRADLSALNAGSSQTGDSRPPPPQSQQPVSAAAPPMTRQISDQPSSPVLTERPALPSTASWASRPLQQTSRADSRSTSGTVDSPAPLRVVPAPVEAVKQSATPLPASSSQLPATSKGLNSFMSSLALDSLSFNFAASGTTAEQEAIESYPALFDLNGGARIRARRQREAARPAQFEPFRAADYTSAEAATIRGSLQLGGEPEDRSSSAQPSEGGLDSRFIFGEGATSPSGLRDRALTPQQHQQMLLQSIKSAGTPVAGAKAGSTAQALHSAPGHQRNASRFSFANDTASASATVKPVANQKLMAQQSTMMPPAGASTQFGTQQQSTGFFTSNVQGPPPGLKTSGTPPVSGGMTFAQGHGFTTGGLPYGASTAATRNANDEMMSNLLRNRGVDAAAKLDQDFPPLGPARQASISSIPPGLQGDSTRRSSPAIPPGLEEVISSRRSTPTVPPGLGKPLPENFQPSASTDKPTALPDLEGSGSRPSSRSGLRRVLSNQVVPVVPLRMATPTKPISRPATPGLPAKDESKAQKAAVSDAIVPETASAKADAEAEKSTQQLEAEIASSSQSSRAKQPASRAIESPVTAAPALPAAKKSLDTVRRKHPGKLDISAAVPSAAEVVTATASGKYTDASAVASTARISAQAQSMASVPSSPTASSVASPANRPAPRTIRVVQTPKTETPPPISASTPALASVLTTAARKLPSRQPSVASMNMPGTPSSEQVSISDNISVTSTSQSRANSPPPVSRVGSAPVRAKTKSQAKKERQERAKAMEELKVKAEDDGKAATVDEPAQEAIVSRKKKTKKEKEVKPKPKVVKEETVVEASPVADRVASPAAEVKAPTPVERAPATPPPPPMKPVLAEPSPPATPTFNPAQFMRELLDNDSKASQWVDAFLRMPVANAKGNPGIVPNDLRDPASWQIPDYNIKLTREEIDSLLSPDAKPISWNSGDGRLWSRTMITPGGAQLRGLSEEQERRFCELEKKVMQVSEDLRFRPTKPQNETAFPAFDLKALKKSFEASTSRGISVMEQMVQDGNSMKKGAFLVDEASKYINEFVMPPATPPQSSGRGTTSSAQQQGLGGQSSANNTQHGQPAQSLEALERQLQEAKKAVDEREGALRRAIRKNKKLLGLS